MIGFLLAAIISGFGFAIGGWLATALARQLPAIAGTLKDRVRSVDASAPRRWLRWSIIWRAALAVIFVLITGGFGVFGLAVGYGLHWMRTKRQQRQGEVAIILPAKSDSPRGQGIFGRHAD